MLCRDPNDVKMIDFAVRQRLYVEFLGIRVDCRREEREKGCRSSNNNNKEVARRVSLSVL